MLLIDSAGRLLLVRSALVIGRPEAGSAAGSATTSPAPGAGHEVDTAGLTDFERRHYGGRHRPHRNCPGTTQASGRTRALNP